MTSPTPSQATVSNTSCLIALASIARLDLLERLYQEVLIPQAVADEWGLPLPPWLKVQAIGNQALAQALRIQLGPGEAEAITLAVEIGPARLILDDQRARRIAANLQIRVTGTVGMAIAARQKGLLPLARPLLDQLQAAGFWMSHGLYQRALQIAGE